MTVSDAHDFLPGGMHDLFKEKNMKRRRLTIQPKQRDIDMMKELFPLDGKPRQPFSRVAKKYGMKPATARKGIKNYLQYSTSGFQAFMQHMREYIKIDPQYKPSNQELRDLVELTLMQECMPGKPSMSRVAAAKELGKQKRADMYQPDMILGFAAMDVPAEAKHLFQEPQGQIVDVEAKQLPEKTETAQEEPQPQPNSDN